MFDIPAIAAGLPVGEQARPLALAAESAGARMIVTAPAGSGKTTVVPAVMANAREALGGGRERVIITQPRRMAARAA
ncbi:hypothetical protein, partial [uncultured Propionibacterium sp.]|uniref:hypothetical protein n=1 Tax=uncultured Propionibacterium sp. TaxID=218066 RepID=UPI00292D1F86